MKKRILAMVLILGMLLTMLPVQVFAEDPVQTPSGQVEHHFETVTDDSVAEQAPQDQEESSVLGEEDSSSQTETTEVTESESSATELPEVIETEATEAEPPKRNTETSTHTHFMSTGDCSAPTINEEGTIKPPQNEMTFEPISSVLGATAGKDRVIGSDGGVFYYYLDRDVSFGGGGITVKGEVNICLNGHQILSSIYDYADTLRICDCTGTGSLTCSSTYGVEVNDGTQFQLYGGSITVNGSYGIKQSAGSKVLVAGGQVSAQQGIYAYTRWGSASTLEILGGSVTGTVNAIYLDYFGYSNSDTVLIKGGTLTGPGNSKQPGAFYVYPYSSGLGTLDIRGGTIQGTTNTTPGLYINNKSSKVTLKLSGSPLIQGGEGTSDISYSSSDSFTPIVIEDSLNHPEWETYSVNVTTTTSKLLTTGWSEHNGMGPIAPFSSTDMTVGVLLNDGEVVPGGTVGELYLIKGHAHDGVLFENELTQAEFESKGYSFKDGDSYYLAETMEFANDLVIEGTVKLCTNGHLVKCYRMCLAPGAKLTLCDCTGDGELLFYFNEEPIIVGADNEFHFYGGTLDIANSEYAILNQGTMSLGWKARLASVHGGVAVKQEGTFLFSGIPYVVSSGANFWLAKDRVITIAGNIADDVWYTVETEDTELPVVFTSGWSTYEANTKVYPFIHNILGVQKSDGGELQLREYRDINLTVMNGTAAADHPTKQIPGEPVSIPVTPNAGYDKVSLTAYYTDSSNGQQELPVEYTGGCVVFTMPDGDVTITVSCVKPHKHCLYGASCEDLQAGRTCGHEIVNFDRDITSFEDLVKLDGDTAAAGIQLMGDLNLFLAPSEGTAISCTQGIEVLGKVKLCLNGNTLTMGNNIITVKGTLEVCDCSESKSGSVIGSFVNGMITAAEGATVKLYGGTFTSSAETIVNGLRARLNITNAKVITTWYANAIVNYGGIVNLENAHVEAEASAADDYHRESCGIYNYGFDRSSEDGEDLPTLGGTVTVNAGSTVKGGHTGISNRAGAVAVNGGEVQGCYNGIYNSSVGYQPFEDQDYTVKNLIRVTGGEVSAQAYGIHNQGGELVVSGGIVESTGDWGNWTLDDGQPRGIYNENGGTVVISGENTVVRTEKGQHALCNQGGVVTIENGNFTAPGKIGVIYHEGTYSNPDYVRPPKQDDPIIDDDIIILGEKPPKSLQPEPRRPERKFLNISSASSI